MKYRADIDGLRAVAVVPVVLNHAGVPGFSGGFVGVDVFFVISGFLITRILAEELDSGQFSLAAFYERRVRRILPALFVMLAICLVVGAFRLLPQSYETLAAGAMATILFVSNIWFWSEAADYFAPEADFNPLLHTWSLAVEEQFYVVFPLLLWLLMVRMRGWTVPVIMALTVVSFVAAVWKTDAAPDAAFFLSPYRVWELSLGSILALTSFGRNAPVLVRSGIGLMGLGAIATAIIFYDDATRFPGMAALLPCLGAAAVIWAGQAGSTLAGRLLTLPPLVWFGLISYSLYLWHWPVLVYLRIQSGTTEIAQTDVALAIVASVVLAWASWRFVERPTRRANGAAPSRRGCFKIAGLTGVALFAVATVVDQSDGLPSRLPDDVLAIYEDVDWGASPFECEDADFRKPECMTGTGIVDVLIWGDSHAASAWPAVSEFAETRGLNASISWQSACSPLLGILRRADSGKGVLCAAQNDDVLAALRDMPVSQVILIARWPIMAEGKRFPDSGGPPPVFYEAGTKDRVHDPDGNFEVYRRAVLRTVAAIRETGSKVVLLSGVPEIGWEVPEGVARSRFTGAELRPLPTIDFVRQRHGRANAVLRQAAEQEGVTLIDVNGSICRPECPILHDGRLLYRDNNHLTPFGARTLLLPLLSAHLP